MSGPSNATVNPEAETQTGTFILPWVKMAGVVSLLVIFVILGLVALTAPENHSWPSSDSLTLPLKPGR